MKVAIIGGSLLGLYLGWKLAQKNNDVYIFERKEKIGGKVCSGLYSKRILSFIPQTKNLIKNKINRCLIHFPKKTVDVYFKNHFFVFDRNEVDNLLKELAEKEKVKLILNKNITQSDLKIISQEFERVIGCDGSNSITRKFLNLKNPGFYLGIKAIEKKEDYSNFVETFATKNGFLWKIPRGKEIEWGIMEKINLARKMFDRFLKERKISVENIESAIIPQGFLISNNDKITLCGDAMGLTKPWSGGGVIWGLFAANLLLKNFPNFKKYHNELKKLFFLNVSLSKFIKKMVYFLGFNLPSLLPKKKMVDGDFLF